MDPGNLLKISVFTFLPLLFLLRAYYGYIKHKQYGEQKISIFSIAKMKNADNAKLVGVARCILGLSIVAYPVIAYAIILYRNQ